MQVCAGEEQGVLAPRDSQGCVPPANLCPPDILGGLRIIPLFPTHSWLLNFHFLSLSGDRLSQRSSSVPAPPLSPQTSQAITGQHGRLHPWVPFIPIS